MNKIHKESHGKTRKYGKKYGEEKYTMEEKNDFVEETIKDNEQGEKIETENNTYNKVLLNRIKRVEILSIISIILLIGVLVVSFVNNRGPVPQVSSAKALPSSIDKAVANRIITDIKDAYNSGDINKTYNLMGEYAKTLVSIEDFEKSLEQMKILGKMENASYTHYTYLQQKEGADWYILNYVTTYEAGAGNATVTIRVVDNSWEIVGFRFNVESIKNIKK